MGNLTIAMLICGILSLLFMGTYLIKSFKGEHQFSILAISLVFSAIYLTDAYVVGTFPF